MPSGPSCRRCSATRVKAIPPSCTAWTGWRNVDDLRCIVQRETKRGVRVQFVKENLTFTGEDSPMANLMLSVLGAVSQFERDLIKERQKEGIALAKQRGAYRGRGKALPGEQVAALRRRASAGEKKARLAREFGISRETLYQYLRQEHGERQRESPPLHQT